MKRFGILGAVIFFFSCGVDDVEYDNPLDPGNPDYEEPNTTISSPQQGITYYEHSFVATWAGNKEDMSFRTKLDDGNWSHQLSDADWYAYEFMNLEYLDEGEHAFLVQGRYISGDVEPQPDSVTFSINAVTGPALRFYHMQTTASINDQITLDIYAEEVSNIAGAEIIVEFDTIKVRVDGWNIGTFMETAGQEPLSFWEIDTSFWEIDTTLGVTILDIGVMGATPDDVSGTGIIASLEITLLAAGETELTFNNQSTLRDNDNNEVVIVEMVKGIILVE